MNKVLIMAMAVTFSFLGHAQKKHLSKDEIKEAIETGNIQDLPSPKHHEDTEFYTPVPKNVKPFSQNGVPSDAIVLFDGTNMEEWVNQKDNGPVTWKLDKEEKSMSISKGKKGKRWVKKATIVTKRNFGAVQLHAEWRSPAVVKSRTGQARGNSGVAFDARYEIQILDNNDNDTYTNGMVGSIYKQAAPLVNPTLPTGEWNSFDVIYHPPVFENGKRIKDGTITAIQNGVLIQDHFAIKGACSFIGWPRQEVHGKGPIRLQDHGSPVSYRNIWVRELK